MANNIVLKTYRGGSVTPLDDAIIQQTVIATNGIFKGCNVTYARGNVLHVSQGFGMIKGRFFEVYDCEVGVILNSGSGTLQGRLYIHMDLSNADEPIQLLTETASVLTDLTGDEDVNYNNTSYDLELATFGVTRMGITNLVATFEKITGASGSGGASTLQRSTEYFKGDFVTCKTAPGWVTLYCSTPGVTAAAEPVEYAGIAEVGDRVTDGTCVFTARDVVGEIDVLKDLFTDTETSIAGLEDGLQELREELNHKAENLPPPVGTIKYSAVDPGEEWVKCDGSFVGEDDYPELLPLLNHKEPTATDLLNAYTADKAGAITNTCVFNGSIWAYLVDAHLLLCVPPSGTAKTIPVTGAETLSGATPTYLSICGGSLYLTQIGGTQTKILMFELVSFAGTETEITMTAVTTYVSNKVTQTANQYTIPYVVDVGGTKMMTLLLTESYLYYITWKAGQYATSATMVQGYCNAYSGSISKIYTSRLAAKFGFSAKNQNEAIYATRFLGVQDNGNSYGVKFWFSIGSMSQSLYGTPESDPYYSFSTYANMETAIEKDERGKYIQKFFGENYIPQMITLPSGANNEYLYNVDLVDRKVTLMHGRYNGGTLPEWRELNIKLPSRAVLFTDSVCYVAEQSMWFIFVGTGLLFGSKLATSGWGYIDTMDLLGLVAKYGCITYLPGENALYLSGLNTAGVPVVCKLLFDGAMDFTGEGAWLPVLVKDGIPAYIKAKTTE
ncbi:MAG: hypothetical protein K2O45_10595 [Oscillospiraceae bacterium]|nr:hypothetical protein [Oscillospiraceae bacterium]